MSLRDYVLSLTKDIEDIKYKVCRARTEFIELKAAVSDPRNVSAHIQGNKNRKEVYMQADDIVTRQIIEGD